jgi:hypothetical protein
MRILCRHARVGVAQKVLHGPQIAGVQVSQRARRVSQGMIGDARLLQVRFPAALRW